MAAKTKKMVSIKLYKAKGMQDEEFVSVNGEIWRVPRGKVVEVPDYIAQVLDYSEKQKEAAMEYMEKLMEDAKSEALK